MIKKKTQDKEQITKYKEKVKMAKRKGGRESSEVEVKGGGVKIED